MTHVLTIFIVSLIMESVLEHVTHHVKMGTKLVTMITWIIMDVLYQNNIVIHLKIQQLDVIYHVHLQKVKCYVKVKLLMLMDV